MEIKTYPEMNETIKDLLRRSEEPMNLYIVARIEELERQVKDLTPPPNDPLTLDELREMDGEPVWTQQDMFPDDCGFRVIRRVGEFAVEFTDMRHFPVAAYGKTWLAYRRKPEEGKE